MSLLVPSTFTVGATTVNLYDAIANFHKIAGPLVEFDLDFITLDEPGWDSLIALRTTAYKVWVFPGSANTTPANTYTDVIAGAGVGTLALVAIGKSYTCLMANPEQTQIILPTGIRKCRAHFVVTA